MNDAQRAFHELAARIREIQEANGIHISELEPGVVYGPPHAMRDELKFAWAILSMGSPEIVIER